MNDHDDATDVPVDQPDGSGTDVDEGVTPDVAVADSHDPSAFEPDTLRANGPDSSAPPAGPLGLLNDVDMEVTVELGRTVMPIRELLALQPGMVVEIDRAAGAPIDVLVNGRLIARGEVVVIDEEFGVRITDIVSQREVA